MPNRNVCVLLLVMLGLGSVTRPAVGQGLIPHTLQLDSAQLEQQGLILADEAAQLARFQQFQLALPRAQLATQLAPKKHQTWAILGSLYLQAEELDKGITALERAQSLEPDNAAILFALGSAHFQQQKYAEAIEKLQAGLKLKPEVPGALFDLGNAYYKLNKFEDAIAQYEKAIAQDSKFWPAMNNIGLVKYELGNVEAALGNWRTAMSVDPTAAEPQMAMAVALYTQGDREQGVTIGEAALRLDARYADVKFLQENLWGDRLLKDTQNFLQTPQIKATLAQTQNSPVQPPGSP